MAFPFDCFLCDKNAGASGPIVDPGHKMPCSPCSWTLQTSLSLLLEPLDLATVEQIAALFATLRKRIHSVAYVKDRFNIASSVLDELINAKFVSHQDYAHTLGLTDQGLALVTLGKADGFWPSIMESTKAVG